MLTAGRFWPNVTVLAMVHVAIIVTLVLWKGDTKRPNLESIMWLDAGTTVTLQSAPGGRERVSTKTPPNEAQSKPEEEEQSSAKTASSIHRAAPKAQKSPPTKREKTVGNNSTPKSQPKKRPISDKQSAPDQNETGTLNASSDLAEKDNGRNWTGSGATGAAQASDFTSYGRMMHDRFYSDWVQPKTSVAAGAKMSTLVRIRIERDGRISKFTIVRPSGNVVVDESVAEIAKRVTQIEPLPNGLATNTYYEVNINFELNPTE
jgi:TonB family protein